MAPASLLVARLRVCSSWATSSCMIRVSQHLCCVRPFSSSAQPILEPDPAGPPPTQPLPSEHKTGLSARMSFVFDQIDAMERMRGAKDDALERIRAWRQAKKRQDQGDDGSDCKADSMGILASGRAVNEAVGKREYVPAEEGMDLFKKEIELIHPWPEWIELMERLLKQNYFDHRRFDEDQMVKNLPIELPAIADDVGFDFTRDWNTVRTACLNFGRDRFDILRSLSKKDLQILVGYGCPSTDRKVVFSAKLLRKHAHLDEGDVCSSCKLRSTCSNGFLLTQKEEEARTIDVMRILLTFGFDPINSLVENKSLLETKTIKLTVRKLLHDVARLSAVPIDPNLPPPVIKKPPPKVKQPPPPPKRRVGRDDVEMKKGDWLCPKCDFMNFAKNNVCLQCDANRPKRQLLPGEWECPQCNFLNYRRNMACFRCEHRRPPDEFTGEETQSQHPGPRPPRLDKLAGLSSQAWNFDFDDNESDGADVAAFEFADPPRPSGTPLDLRGVDYAPPDAPRPRAGFNDFDDEDDDVDSYEIDDRSNSERIHKLGTSRAFANQDDHDLNDDDDSDDDDVDVDDDDDNYDQEGPRERSFKEKGRSAFNPGDRTPRALNFSSDQRRDLGRNSGRGTERRGRSFVSDGSDSEGFSSSRPWMNQPPQAGRSRAVGLNQLDNDDDTYDDDDDNDDRAHHGAGRGRNVGMTEGWRRERLDNRTNNRPRSDQMEYSRGGRVNQAEERSRGYDDQMEHRKGGRGNQAKERSRGYNDRMEDRKGGRGNQAEERSRGYNDWMVDRKRGRGNQAEERSRGYNDWMVDRKRGRGNQAEERSRGGYNYRGHSGRSDHRTGGSRNHGELPRRGGSNQWASGGRDFR